MAESRDDGVRTALAALLHTLTSCSARQLPSDALAELKGLCRTSEANVSLAYRMWFERLREERAQIRFAAVLVAGELFARSAVFRRLLVDDLPTFLTLTVGASGDDPSVRNGGVASLPPPRQWALLLRTETLSLLRKWGARYGAAYRQLELAQDFLARAQGVDFGSIEASTAAERELEAQRQASYRRAQQARYEEALQSARDGMAEIRSSLGEIDACFQLLNPLSQLHAEASEALGTADAATGEAFAARYGLGSASYSLSVTVDLRSPLGVKASQDNLVILRTLSELSRLARVHHLPAMSRWMDAISRGGQPNTDEQARADQAVLQSIMDLRVAVNTALAKCDELGVDEQLAVLRPKETAAGGGERERSDDEGDEDALEDVPDKPGYERAAGDSALPASSEGAAKEGFESSAPPVDDEAEEAPSSSAAFDPTLGNSAAARRSQRRQNAADGIQTEEVRDAPAPSSMSGAASSGSELMACAPVLPYDEAIRFAAPDAASFQSESFHRFWGSGERERPIHGEFLQRLRSRVALLEPEVCPVERTCRAPLPDGRLCPRRDRRRCPFHGAIVDRDASGRPRAQESHGDDGPPAQDAAASASPAAPVDHTPKKRRRPGAELGDAQPQPSARMRLLHKLTRRRADVNDAWAQLEAGEHRDKYGDHWHYY